MNIPPGERPDDDGIITLPDFVQDLVETHYRTRSDKAPNLTIGQWLRAQPGAVQRRERSRLLWKSGLLRYCCAMRGHGNDR
jgi:hypothetical protein